MIRLDFLISIPRRDTQSVPFQVHTCELTKCGGSTCGLQVSLCTVAVEDLLKGSRNHFLLLPEERHQSQLDRSKLPERKSGRYGRDQVDSNKTEKETQLESHERRAWPIMAYLVILGANRPIVALYGPCLKCPPALIPIFGGLLRFLGASTKASRSMGEVSLLDLSRKRFKHAHRMGADSSQTDPS